MSSNNSDTKAFSLPVKWVPADRFAAVDCGTSLLKVVYILKEDREKLTSPDRECKINIHMKSFPRDQLDETLDYIVSKSIPIDGAKEGLIFMATGTGAGLNVVPIQQKLGARMLIPLEFDCFVDSAHKLVVSTPKADVVCPLSAEAQNSGWEYIRNVCDISSIFQETSEKIEYPMSRMQGIEFWKPTPAIDDSPDAPYAKADPDIWPFILVMMGSTGASFLVRADGRCEYVDLNQRAGRTFIGMGSMLTGAQSYDEIFSLAEKGDNANVDKLLSEGFEGNVSEKYLAFQKTGRMVSSYFGKGYQTKLDQWNKEDVARAWVCMTATDMAQWVLTTAIAKHTKRVLLCGSLPNHSLMQYEITANFNRLRCNFPEENVELEFIKHGGHLGALGALICEPSPGMPDIPTPKPE